jgi:prepilin-type N-terminal cleavage/methylation domain-containing protein
MIKKAFTLLEMLVVIGIIGILVGLGAVSYSTAQKKARDAKRKQDLKAFQNAMEQCYAVNNYAYPIITGGGTTSISEDCPSSNGPDLTITDPSNKTYSVSSSTDSYSVSVALETGGTFTISNQQ